MTEQSPTRRANGNPFADIPAADYVRDGVAAILLFVSFSLPWDVQNRAADRIEVVLLTLVSLASLALPYLARAGVLPSTWTVHTTRGARLLANAPYVLLVVVTAIVDLASGDDGHLLGSAAALGLAGAILAAQPHACELGPEPEDARASDVSVRALAGIGALAAAGTVLGLVMSAVDGPGALVVLALVALAVLLLALSALPVLRVVRGDESWRLLLVGLGIAVAVSFVLGSGSMPLLALATLRAVGFALLLVPAAAALAASPAVARRTHADSEVARWTGVATGALVLLAVTAGVIAVVGLVGLVDDSTDQGTSDVLSLVLGLLVLGAAIVARRTLVADPARGRMHALAAAGLSLVLGIVLLIVGSDSWGAVGTARFLLAFGLPAIVVVALTGTRAVREHFAEQQASGPGSAAGAYAWSPRPKAERAEARSEAGAEEPVPEAEAEAPAAAPEPARRAPRVAGHRTAAARDAASEDVSVPEEPATEATDTGRTSSVRGGADRGADRGAGTGEFTQVITTEPERTGYAARPGLAEPWPDEPAPVEEPSTETAPVAAGGIDDSTQVIPAQGRHTAAEAADPATPLEVLAAITSEQPELRPYVASNPSTYPALLDWLSQLGDPAVDAALRSRRY